MADLLLKREMPGPRSTRRQGAKGATRKAARTPEKRRTLSFNWLNRLFILVGVGVVLAAGLQAYLTLDAIAVEQVSVTGKLEHTQREAVEAMVEPALVGGFLSADLVQMRQQLEALPWIYAANVRRRWPNALEIHVVEQLPIAHWGDGGFLNHEAAVFQSPNAGRWEGLPTLRGPEGSERDMVARYQRLEELLAPVRQQVAVLAQDDRGQVTAELESGIVLLLGNTDFRERVQRFVALYQQDIGQRAGEVARVDLRYSAGAAVAFDPSEQLVGLASE